MFMSYGIHASLSTKLICAYYTIVFVHVEISPAGHGLWFGWPQIVCWLFLSERLTASGTVPYWRRKYKSWPHPPDIPQMPYTLTQSITMLFWLSKCQEKSFIQQPFDNKLENSVIFVKNSEFKNSINPLLCILHYTSESWMSADKG